MINRLRQLTRSRFFRAALEDYLFLSAFFTLVIMLLASLLSPLLAPYDPYNLAILDLMDAELPPAWQAEGERRFLLGTDTQGRDLLSTILYGTRLSIFIGICAVFMQSVLGVFLGVVAGYFGGKLDSLIMRIADLQLSLSTLMLAIIGLALIKAFFGIETYEAIALYMIIIVIGFSEWPQYARTVRATVRAEKKKEYVEAARSIGLSNFTIMFKHITPNTLSAVLVISSIQIAGAIIIEASLSFIGLGMPPTQPSLGSLIQQGFGHLLSGEWWITIVPSLFLILLVLVINLCSDWLRDQLNPKLVKH